MNRYRVPFVPVAVSLLVVGLAMAGFSLPAAAQAKRALTLVDLLNVPNLTDPQLSPDGRQVLYTLARADWKANRRVSHVWRIGIDGSNPIQLTNGESGESVPRWSPDGATVAFIAARGDGAPAQIHLIPNDGGEARQVSRHATAVSAITWSSDGGSIYFVAAEAKSAEAQEKEKARDDVYGFDENYQQRHLWKVAVADGAEQRITSGDFSVGGYTLSRDGTRVAHHRTPDPLLGSSDRGEVWVMNADGSGAVQLTKNGAAENGAELSPDNSQVLYLAQANEKFEPYYNRKIFLEPAAGGPVRVLTADLPYEVERATWSADGRSIVFAANMGLHSELFQIDVAGGKPRQLTNGTHALTGASYSPKLGRVVLTIDEPDNPGDVWTMAIPDGSPSRVTHVFDYLAQEFTVARQEKVQWKGADGVTVEGLLFYPTDYQPGRRYPLAVQTHGGPQASDKFGFGFWEYYPQGLAARGWVVLQPNYRGSTGYGDGFLRDMVLHYYRNSHLDVMAGADHVISMGIADPDRMVKMGWSGGGHMTNKIVTFTNRFKAASSGAGAANWISMYAQSDTRVFRTPWFGGTPWQKNAPIDLYWEHSPLKYVSNVTTPTLFLVGHEDPRVPEPQGVEMYRALKSLGVPTHLYIAPREPHVWQELRHELFKMNIELEWFEKHALGRTYTWEKAPK